MLQPISSLVLTIPDKVSAILSSLIKNPLGMMVMPLYSTLSRCSPVQGTVEFGLGIHQPSPQFTVIHTYLGPYSPLRYAYIGRVVTTELSRAQC